MFKGPQNSPAIHWIATERGHISLSLLLSSNEVAKNKAYCELTTYSDQAETNVDINRLTLPLPSVQRSAEFTCDTLDSGRKESIVPDCSTDLKRGEQLDKSVFVKNISDHAETSVEIDNQRSPLPDIERSMEFTSETLDSTLGIESNELRRETNYYRGRELRQSLQQDSLQLSYNQPTDLTSISSES